MRSLPVARAHKVGEPAVVGSYGFHQFAGKHFGVPAVVAPALGADGLVGGPADGVAGDQGRKADRGKLIMACGTGKTFTALRIAEKVAPGGHVLFLVPSLSLMSQSLREWTAEADKPFHSLAVCSNASIKEQHAGVPEAQRG